MRGVLRGCGMGCLFGWGEGKREGGEVEKGGEVEEVEAM